MSKILQMDDLAMLRAGVRFTQRVGRTPRRKDFRQPSRDQWESKLGIQLPSADIAEYRFGSWTGYLNKMGYDGNTAASLNIQRVEAAAIGHCEDVYPTIELVKSEQNAYDAYIEINGEVLRTEIKGSSLQARKDNPDSLYLSFKTHNRELSKTVDRLICVGVGINPETGAIEPIVRMEFPKTGLRLLDGKSTVMIYSTGIWGGQISKYSPYIKWRKAILPGRVKDWIPDETD